MPAFRDRKGEKFGRLTIVSRATNDPRSDKVRWLCRCDCGNEVIACAANLHPGRTTSCGCLQAERTGIANKVRTKHGHAKSAGGNKRLITPTYQSWKAMLERVRRPATINYHLYGGRGIKVCDRWQGPDGFVNFLADMGERPNGKTIDRTDNDGNYEPGNCRWATKSQQRQNQRHSPELEAERRESLRKGRSNRWK